MSGIGYTGTLWFEITVMFTEDKLWRFAKISLESFEFFQENHSKNEFFARVYTVYFIYCYVKEEIKFLTKMAPYLD